jgi:hypothetical protein
MKRLILIFCLLPGFVSASSHKRLDSILSAANTWAGNGPGGNAQMPDSVGIPFVNLSIQEVTTQFPAVVKYGSDTLLVGDPRIAVDSTYEELLWCRTRRYSQSETNPSGLPFLRIVPKDSVYEYAQMGKAEARRDDTDPIYVWLSGGYIHVHPEPATANWIYFGYTANGLKLTDADDTTDVRPKYRKLVVMLTAWQMCIKMDKLGRADRLAAAIAIEQLRLER